MMFKISKQLFLPLLLLSPFPGEVKGANKVDIEDIIQEVQQDSKKIEDKHEGGEQNFGQRSDSGGLGERCFRHSYCESKICSGTFLGVCAECDDDDDCGDTHLPGTMTKAFCYKGGDYPVCSEFKRGEPIPSGDGYPVWLGTDNDPPVWVPRHIIQGPAMTLVWHFDLNNQPEGFEALSVSSTHVQMPYQKMHAGYSMEYPMFDEQETGILSVRFARNPTSVVTPFAKAWAQEKYHTLTTNKPLPTARGERIREEVAGRSAFTNSSAQRLADSRAFSEMAHIGLNTANMIVESNQDVRQMIDVRNYIDRVHSGELSADELDIPEFDDRSAEAIEALIAAKTLPSIKSENHCSHFEDHNSFNVEDDYMEIPLNKPIHMIKGITQFFPNYFFALNSGALVVKYDAKTNSLEFRFQAFQQSRLNGDMLDNSVESGLWLSPIFDHYSVHAEDGRTDEYYDTDLDRWEIVDNLAQATQIPLDYSYFDHRPTCSAETAESINWEDVESEMDPDANWWSVAFNSVGIVDLTVDSARCASTYMKADNNPGVVGLGTLQLVVLAHIITEMYPEDRREMLTSTWWDDYIQFYRGNEEVVDREKGAIADELKDLENELEGILEELKNERPKINT